MPRRSLPTCAGSNAGEVVRASQFHGSGTKRCREDGPTVATTATVGPSSDLTVVSHAGITQPPLGAVHCHWTRSLTCEGTSAATTCHRTHHAGSVGVRGSSPLSSTPGQGLDRFFRSGPFLVSGGPISHRISQWLCERCSRLVRDTMSLTRGDRVSLFDVRGHGATGGHAAVEMVPPSLPSGVGQLDPFHPAVASAGTAAGLNASVNVAPAARSASSCEWT